jgi:hypothetical protein
VAWPDTTVVELIERDMIDHRIEDMINGAIHEILEHDS